MTDSITGASFDSIVDLLDNPFWNALGSEHTKFAISAPLARRYPADVVPFAGLQDGRTEALAELRELLEPEESIYVTGDELSECLGIELLGQLNTWQMVYLDSGAVQSSSHLDDRLRDDRPGHGDQPTIEPPTIERMTDADAPAMVALTDVVFPGYFRARTYIMGSYYGIRVGGELVAMAGERVSLPGIREISGICTHPAHTGRGYAGHLIGRILGEHADAGLRTFLHVGTSNERAIALYERFGFVKRKKILFHRLRRVSF
ncbi:MAG: GNAT family N-acetyltransferase [Terriglobales bacterium]|jgi:ribosomal protein S18 acetylase RimI-like enzyme